LAYGESALGGDTRHKALECFAHKALYKTQGGASDLILPATSSKIPADSLWTDSGVYCFFLFRVQAETHAARSTLKEAEAEMEAIHFEKKQLVQQWKSSLIGITRRDEALQVTRVVEFSPSTDNFEFLRRVISNFEPRAKIPASE